MNTSKTTAYFVIFGLIALLSAVNASVVFAQEAIATPAPETIAASAAGTTAPATIPASAAGNSAPETIAASAAGNTAPGTVAASAAGNTAPGTIPASTVTTGSNSGPAPVTPITPPATAPAVVGTNSGPGRSSNSTGSGTTGSRRHIVEAESILATAQCGKYINGPIRIGSASNDVSDIKKLQSFLIVTQNADLELNGIYDEKTIAAVRTFQKAYESDVLAPWGITTSTGEIIITTNGKINALICKRIYELTKSDKDAIAFINATLRLGSNVGLGLKTPVKEIPASGSVIVKATDTPTPTAVVATPRTESSAASIILAVPRAIGSFFNWLFHR